MKEGGREAGEGTGIDFWALMANTQQAILNIQVAY
jgi:hypothetical protein